MAALTLSRVARQLTCTATAAVLASECAHWLASKRHLPPDPPLEGPCALVVLGYPSRRDGRLHPVQKWRTQLAARAWPALGAERVVFSGGPSHGRPPEALVMAAHAQRLGVPENAVATETRATSTWENVAFSQPLVDEYPRLAIVSDPLHAARARRYLWQQSPGLASRLVSAGEYRFLDHCWLKLLSAVYELYLALAPGRRERIGTGAIAPPAGKTRRSARAALAFWRV